MKVVALTPPGRFPTVVADPGLWWTALAASGRHEPVRFSANAAWWRVLCSPAVEQALLAPLSFTQRLRRRVEWKVAEVDLKSSGGPAGQALESLCTPEPYQTAARYIETIAPLAEHLAALNKAQAELQLSLEGGVRVAGLDYDRSAALVEYARENTLLSELIRASLAECPGDVGLLAVGVTSAEDLLCAMIAVRHLRERNPQMHACLADHGYENFSLRPHLARLREAGTLTAVFDMVIESKGDRDLLLPALAEALAAGDAPRGFLTRDDLAVAEPPPSDRYCPPPPTPTFSCEPVFWTRVSSRRCYWSRCAFCVQNNKYDDPRTPSVDEVPGALDRVERLVGAGYRTVIFSDEALPPPLVRSFCEGILERGLEFRWACRCRLERGLDRALFQLMRRAGCYEVLYGLESISPRMQTRMCKYARGIEADRIREIFRAMHEAGIGMHVNLLAGFPGDTPDEVHQSAEFTVEALRGLQRGTFTLNRFALFPDTPVMKEPDAFGVVSIAGSGDMPSRYEYRLDPELEADTAAVDRELPALRERLLSGLGWRTLGTGPGPETAISLYFDSGHGSIFKKQQNDAFAALIREKNTEGAT